MNIFLKKLQTPQGVREIYAAVPNGTQDRNAKNSVITVLLDEINEKTVSEFLNRTGSETLIDNEKNFFIFPVPQKCWNYALKEDLQNDSEFILSLSSQLGSGVYTNGWRAINDVHYLIGEGSGASMVHTLISLSPAPYLAAAVCTVGGALPKSGNFKYSPVPALLINADKDTADYYIKAGDCEKAGENLFECAYNKSSKVEVLSGELSKAVMNKFYADYIKKIRRTNTSPEGDADRRIDPENCGFKWHIDDTSLGDNNSLPHDFIECVPQKVLLNPDKKVPLVIFAHGASDNPLKAADMIKMHEIGEREGFITVYPFSCNKYSWNLARDTSVENGDDVAYFTALINFMKSKYPIDEKKIYMSGFSNGAGMAMVYALSHPEIVAAAAPVDSTFPYATMARFKPSGFGKQFVSEYFEPGETVPKRELPPMDAEKNLKPLKEALRHQEEKRYLMPIMYFYGTRESEYPIGPGSNQELSQEFWKKFNGIPVKEMQENLEPDAVGVVGDDVYTLNPDPAHPKHIYKKHVFYTKKGQDYYNLMLMRGKAHDVHPAERELAWQFLSRFSRLENGELLDTGSEK